jgi:hypothetical protein
MPISPIQMTRSALLDALAEGAVVATGNARLARSLAAEFDRRMLGPRGWPRCALVFYCWNLPRQEQRATRPAY